MTNQRLHAVVDVASFISLLLTAIFVPFFLDKNLANLFIIPKQYAFIGLVLISFLLFGTKIVLSKKLSFRTSVVDLPILGLLLVSALSSIFSVSLYDSFFGRGEFFVMNFIFLAFLGLFYFLIINFVNSPMRWRVIMDVVIGAGGLSALVFVLKLVFKFDLLAMIVSPVWNSFDKLNSVFGLWLIIVFILAAGQLMKRSLSIGRSLAYFFSIVVIFASLVLLSFNILWWMLLCGLVLLLLLGFSYIKDIRTGWLSVLFVMLILTGVFIIFGSPKSLQSALPAEVALGIKPSWSITLDTMFSGVKNFIIGTGLGTFNYDFSRFRPESFNYDNMAWSLRFGQPFSTFLSLAAEGGVLTLLLFIFIFLFVLGHVFQVWLRNRSMRSTSQGIMGSKNFDREMMEDLRMDVFLVVVGWVTMTVGMGALYFSPGLWWMWWLLLGMIVSGLSFFNADMVSEREWAIEDTPQYSLSFSFVLIITMAAVVMLGIWGVRLYMAEAAYTRALNAKDYKAAEAELKMALSQRGSSDTYHAALAQVYLLQAVEMSRAEKPDLQSISQLMALAVNEAKAAADLAPKSVALWENLATMYENAAALVPEARDWTIKSLTQAIELEPTNPVLWWRLGNNYSVAKNWEEASKSYEKAIELKRDYVGAYTGLANAYEQTNKIDKAIEKYQTILSSASNNVEVLFNYGRLLYNRNKEGDRDNAEKLWLEAARVQPNYSNALYSLGLLYETKGNKSKALEYYYKVKDLNPDNKDIAAKIRAIVGGN
ncbi:tetratricopeptide repeat protein [Patescibacteria group bacterium]|nr:tetratricopeptide repeat protein [Patescibacteria group bacterium]